MDIPDIEVVVIFGAPDSLSQFYQVLHSLFFVYVVVVFSLIAVRESRT